MSPGSGIGAVPSVRGVAIIDFFFPLARDGEHMDENNVEKVVLVVVAPLPLRVLPGCRRCLKFHFVQVFYLAKAIKI